jgi:hypothetical protein
VDLLDEAFSLKHGEGSPQCHGTDLVPVGQASLRWKTLAGLDAAGRDLVPQILGDFMMS